MDGDRCLLWLNLLELRDLCLAPLAVCRGRHARLLHLLLEASDLRDDAATEFVLQAAPHLTDTRRTHTNT